MIGLDPCCSLNLRFAEHYAVKFNLHQETRMKHWTTYRMILWLVLAIVASCAWKNAPAQDIAKMELYAGLNQAVAETLAEADARPTVTQMMTTQTADDEVPLKSRRLWNCDKYEAVSVNVWGVSHHTGDRTGKRKLQQKNTGPGIVYTCNNLSAGGDEMRNSNDGRARILSLFLSTDNLELGPVFIRGSIGVARVSYEVPKYRATAYDTTAIAFACAGLTVIPKLSFCGAPVPKVAGDPAYIGWLNYKVYIK